MLCLKWLPEVSFSGSIFSKSTSPMFRKLIEKNFKGTIDMTKLNTKPKNIHEQLANHDLCLAAAKEIGCVIVNIGGMDLVDKKMHLVMGILWQIIKVCFCIDFQAFDFSFFFLIQVRSLCSKK